MANLSAADGSRRTDPTWSVDGFGHRARRRTLAQGLCVTVGLGTGLLLPHLTVHPMIGADRGADLLPSLGFGVIGLVSIIFSLLFLVVQWAATTFSPRLGLFRDDPLVWRSFAFALGVFVFCVTSALSLGTRTEVSIVVPSIAMVLVLVALVFLYTLQSRAFASIQLGPCLHAITGRSHRVIATVYDRPPGDEKAAGPTLPPATGGTPVTWPGPGAVLRGIDMPALVEAARAHDCLIVLCQATGQLLIRGRPVAHIHGGRLPEDVILAALTPGVERGFDRNPEFGLRLLADIALRGLSPAINDPATSVQALDHIEDLLLLLAAQDLDVGETRDSEGTSRVWVPLPDWGRYVRTALVDVINCAQTAPLVLQRIRLLLRHVLDAGPETRRPLLRERLAWVERLVERGFPVAPASTLAAGTDGRRPS
ncbi:DUF2254 family protein [Streptomyces sp. H39-S7]|uniref:DUF2254 family protein n=1 Tax=Streptomyces sp. H39-S7 TaxID=3004357 RepID=UPI0022B0725D|nr:DUF2254 family protein [Streptomyces sp. H39-S7]MCZ4125153.1 DUF2254 domain-containing protein [Streptomyces sp. H39-S7]